ncbi:MAG: hypothetical protein JW786_11570 [Desulfobacterales bacterium]|nr:hypothetical protein [Desulfobacterales bacterium]
MTHRISIKQLTHEVRQIYRSDRLQAEDLIATYIEKRLNEFSVEERSILVKKLADEFVDTDKHLTADVNIDEEVLARVSALLLGRKVSKADLSSTELLSRLAESLNTIFDELNQLVSVINAALYGETVGEATIRQVIGFQLEDESPSKSLESYLGQIRKAFLTAQQAFKQAAQSKVIEILNELDPDKIAAISGGGLKFGPLRKAELFGIYTEKFHTCRKWFESGRFMEEFLREFEKNCQKMSL